MNNDPLKLTCRFCNSTENLNCHHIWPDTAPKMPYVQKYYDYITDYAETNHIILPSNWKKLFHSSFLPRGPTEDWNLVWVCRLHHPSKNYFTYENAPFKRSNMGLGNGYKKNFYYTLDNYILYLKQKNFNPFQTRYVEELLK